MIAVLIGLSVAALFVAVGALLSYVDYKADLRGYSAGLADGLRYTDSNVTPAEPRAPAATGRVVGREWN